MIIDRTKYVPFGAAEELFYARDAEILVDGPAGTGKTLAIGHYLNLIAETFPGCRILVVRKTRVSLTNSFMNTFEAKVLPPDHPFVREMRNRATRTEYVYPNGAVISLGGLEKDTRLFSTEYDIIYVNEAQELKIEEWEQLLRANRNGVVPWNQLIGDCNPAEDSHWLNQRCTDLDPVNGKTRRLKSWIQDNPLYYDRELGDYTERGRQYVFGNLGGLTGVRYKRLVKGLWVAAEGQVWEVFDPHVHILDGTLRESDGYTWIDLDHDADKERFGRESICMQAYFGGRDYGFRHPGALQIFGQDSEDRCYMIAEWHHTERNQDWWGEALASGIRQFHRPQAPFRKVLSDPSKPEDIERLNTFCRRAGGKTVVEKADNAVVNGLAAVRYALAPAPDGLPRLFFLRDALRHSPDPLLRERKMPASVVEEIPSYVWRMTLDGRVLDEPAKENDDGCDALRYGMNWAFGRHLGKAGIEADPSQTELQQQAGYVLGMKRRNGRWEW